MPTTHAATPGKRVALQKLNSRTSPLSPQAAASALTAQLIGRAAKLSHPTQLTSVVRLDLDLRQLQLPPIDRVTNLQLVPQLKALNLAFNAISRMEGFDALQQLVELNLAENSITEIENLTSLRGLQRLNLSGNQIQRLPPQVSELRQLQVLRLSRNRLEEVADLQHLAPLPLSHLRVDDNPWSNSSPGDAVPFALACVPSLDTINGCEVMPHERKDAALRYHRPQAPPSSSSSSLTPASTPVFASPKVRFDIDANDDDDGADKENATPRRPVHQQQHQQQTSISGSIALNLALCG